MRIPPRPVAVALLAALLLTLASAAPGQAQVAPAAEPVGLADCDRYFARFEACVSARAPEPQRGEHLRQSGLARQQYRRMTTMPHPPDVAAACRDLEKEMLPWLQRTYGCRF